MGLTFGTLAALVVSPISMLAGSAAWRLGVICDGIARWSAFCFVEEMWLLYALRLVRRRRQHRFVENSNRAQRAFALYGATPRAGRVASTLRADRAFALAAPVTARIYCKSILATLFTIDATIIDSGTGAHGRPHGLRARPRRRGRRHGVGDGGLLFLSLCFAWFLLPLRLLASHLNALDLERCPDLGADNNLCIPLSALIDPGEEAPAASRARSASRTCPREIASRRRGNHNRPRPSRAAVEINCYF